MITQRDIAQALGLSQASVSLALKGSPRISESVRIRVAAYAEENNYRIDPALAALADYRTGKRQPGYQGTVAWVTDFAKRDGWRIDPFVDYFDGAKEHLSGNGYLLEEFWMREEGLSVRRSTEIWKARGIECLLLCPQEFAGTRRPDWMFEDFSVVTFGFSLKEPRFHAVAPQGFNSMRLLYQSIRNQGFSRVGFVHTPEIELRSEGSWLGGFLVARVYDGGHAPDPLEVSIGDVETVREWLRRFTPDAVITTHSSLGEEIREGARLENLSVPAIFKTVVSSPEEESGVLFDHRNVGRIAARKLTSLHRARVRGVPTHPEITTLSGVYHPLERSARTD